MKMAEVPTVLAHQMACVSHAVPLAAVGRTEFSALQAMSLAEGGC